MTFDWDHARAFLAAADSGSFTRAARALRLSQPTIGRQIAALEAALGVPLFERNGPGVSLTDAGAELVEPIRAMARAADDVALAAAGVVGHLEGTVRLTAGDMVAAHVLPPVLARVRSLHPGITLEVVATQEIADLRRREADLAIRHIAPDDPELIARRLPDQEGAFYAAPSLLERLGPLHTPEDLARADFVTFQDRAEVARYIRSLGIPAPDERFRIACQNHLVQWAYCRAGLGVAVNMTRIGDADPLVRRVPVDLPRIPVPMWVVSHRALRTSRRLRAVVDIVFDVLGRPPENTASPRP